LTASTFGECRRAPWVVLTASWQHIRARGDAIEALNLAVLCLAALLLVIGWRRLPFSYYCYAAPQLLLLGVRQSGHTPLTSTSRYVLVLFPVFVVLALFVTGKRVHLLWLSVSGCLMLWLLAAYCYGAFVA
jgi:hypothetical protein